MRLNGNFVLRQIAGETLAVPVGDSALKFGGMIVLNPVSAVIFECLKQDTNLDSIVEAVTNRFDIDSAEATEDVTAFLEQMRSENLILD